MDPLSITTSVITLVDIALKIKDSVERVAKNRKKLRYLSEDVLQILQDLQDLCSARENALRGAPELHQSLNRLGSQLSEVHARCDKAFNVPSSSTFAKARAGFKQWLKADDIEEDITRLKEQVQSCLLRFTSIVSARTELISTQTAIASARIEHSVLVLKAQQRANINQFDRLYGQGFIGQERSNLPQPTLFHNIDREYLHMKMRMIAEAYETQDFFQITMEPVSNGLDLTSAYPKPLGVFKSLKTFKGTIAKAWEVLQLLDGHLELSTVFECALSMLWLGCELVALGLVEDAVLNDGCAVQLLRQLCRTPGGHYFLPHLGYALTDFNWCMGDDPEAINYCQEAVETFRCLENPAVEQPANYAYALRSLGVRYLDSGQASQALDCLQEALQVVRSADRTSVYSRDDASSYVISWEASGQVKSVRDTPFTSFASIPEDSVMMQHECLVLFGITNALESLGRHSEALSFGKEAINAMEALQANSNNMPSYIHPLSELLSQLQTTIPTWVSYTIDHSPASSATLISDSMPLAML